MNRLGTIILLACICLLTTVGLPEVGHAASGKVYTCNIVSSYRHPVTNKIEDSGGEGSYATGQGMVEGCMGKTGIMEVTDDGSYYLTFRLGLADYTKNQSFQVQKNGDSSWQTPEQSGVTNQGSDSNGTTNDVCVKVPSKDCIVRGSMYVEAMGRDVVWFFYPKKFQEGNDTDMKATIVTAESKGNNPSKEDMAKKPEKTPKQETKKTAPSKEKGEGDNRYAVSAAQGMLLSTAQQAENNRELHLSKNAKTFLIAMAGAMVGTSIVFLIIIMLWRGSPSWPGRKRKEDQDDEYIYQEE